MKIETSLPQKSLAEIWNEPDATDKAETVELCDKQTELSAVISKDVTEFKPGKLALIADLSQLKRTPEQIAEKTGLMVETVKSYLNHLKAKPAS